MQVSVRMSPAMGRVAGTPYLQLELPAAATVADLLDALHRSHPGLASHLPTCVVLIEGRVVQPEEPLAHGAQVALLQPMAGGSPAAAALKVELRHRQAQLSIYL